VVLFEIEYWQKIDISGGEMWYSKALAWAVDAGLTDGLNPMGNVTREQLVTLLHRYAEYAKLTLPQSVETVEFADSGEVADYAQAAVSALQQAGVVSDKPGLRFDPKGTATRAEVAQVLRRFVEVTGGG
jgi:hypothetical protein